MTINTKFNIGEQVYFLEGNILYRRPVYRIAIEVSDRWGKPAESLTTYRFVLNPGSVQPQEVYKYESELASTKEELINTLQVL